MNIKLAAIFAVACVLHTGLSSAAIMEEPIASSLYEASGVWTFFASAPADEPYLYYKFYFRTGRSYSKRTLFRVEAAKKAADGGGLVRIFASHYNDEQIYKVLDKNENPVTLKFDVRGRLIADQEDSNDHNVKVRFKYGGQNFDTSLHFNGHGQKNNLDHDHKNNGTLNGNTSRPI
jgi:hypothetical protein